MKKRYIVIILFLGIFYSVSAALRKQPVEYVNPLVGTDSKFELSNGNTYPAIAMPWGMNFWTPQTGRMGEGWTYTYSSDKIRGFKQTHQPSPWINDYGQFSLMPITGKPVFDQDERHATGAACDHGLPQAAQLDVRDDAQGRTEAALPPAQAARASSLRASDVLLSRHSFVAREQAQGGTGGRGDPAAVSAAERTIARPENRSVRGAAAPLRLPRNFFASPPFRRCVFDGSGGRDGRAARADRRRGQTMKIKRIFSLFFRR